MRKRAVRYTTDKLVAYYWDGGVAKDEHPVKNISLTGAYISSRYEWPAGTVLHLTLRQRAVDGSGTFLIPFVELRCKIVRQSPDGFGVNFMFDRNRQRKALKRLLGGSKKQARTNALGRASAADEGQALVEYALMVPLLFLLIVNAVNFGGFIYDWIGVANAARAGGQYAAMGSAYASYPSMASLSAITTLIQNETSSLPNASTSNPSVTICENQNGTAVAYPPTGTPPAACPTGVTAPPQDPETITGTTGTSTYTTVAIDVTYTFTPFISGFQFPGLNIFLPTLPTSIRRRTVMRVLN